MPTASPRLRLELQETGDDVMTASDRHLSADHVEAALRRDHIAAEFERCRPYLEAALTESLGEFSLDQVREQLESGWAQLWPLPNGAIVTVLDTFADGSRVCKFWLAGGDLDEIRDSEPVIREWAKGVGCTRMLVYGRHGWLRALPGYRHAYTIITRDLDQSSGQPDGQAGVLH